MISPRKFRFSLKYAIAGLKYLFSAENNIRIHTLVTILVIAAGATLRISLTSWAIIILTIALVWIVEALNTVFERLFDLLDGSYNPIVKIGKDVSAAAVLISAIASIAIALIVFIPRIIELITNWKIFYK
jgi:diacylglycerol kinase